MAAPDNDIKQQRVLLTYQDAKYGRLAAYVLLFALSYGYARVSSQGSEGGVPWYEKAILVIIFLSFFLSIFEALFIINAKMFYKRVEFDADNLYITSKRVETAVPLKKIVRIDMLNTGRGSRGTFYGYEISYIGADGEKAWVYVTIFWKKTGAFDTFKNMVKEQNPSVEGKMVVTTIDGIIGFFKKKKQVV